MAAALLALAAAGACAQSPAGPGFTWGVSAGLQPRRLVERSDDGARLVEESGLMLRVAADGVLRLQSGGALQLQAEFAGGMLDYDGHTQAGAPLTTDSEHRDLALALAWRPWAPFAWGEPWLVLRAVEQRRNIASIGNVAGLTETSSLLMPGLRWSQELAAGGWRWQPSVELRTSVHHRLDVDFRGLYDAQQLTGGRRNELALALAASAAGSPWSWSLEWTHARQAASDRDTLRRGGVAVGTVRQPRIEIDDLMLRLRRAF